MSGGGSAASLNVDLALTRARMCELLASKASAPTGPAFTVGLVASLDLLLGMPLTEAIADLPLDDDVSKAVLSHEGPLGQVLADVFTYEAGADTVLAPLHEAREIYLSSLAWARDINARAGE
jgi:EAL and modified HD-GYP domain-containing signal transduction protein